MKKIVIITVINSNGSSMSYVFLKKIGWIRHFITFFDIENDPDNQLIDFENHNKEKYFSDYLSPKYHILY